MCLAQSEETVNIFAAKIEKLEEQIKEMRSENEIDSLRKFDPVPVEKPPSVSSIFTLLRGGKK